jgi:adenylate kinase
MIANGDYITERQFNKMSKIAHKEAMKKLSKEDRKIIKDTHFIVETSEE